MYIAYSLLWEICGQTGRPCSLWDTISYLCPYEKTWNRLNEFLTKTCDLAAHIDQCRSICKVPRRQHPVGICLSPSAVRQGRGLGYSIMPLWIGAKSCSHRGRLSSESQLKLPLLQLKGSHCIKAQYQLVWSHIYDTAVTDTHT